LQRPVIQRQFRHHVLQLPVLILQLLHLLRVATLHAAVLRLPATVGDTVGAVRSVAALKPDVAVPNIGLAGTGGIQAANQIRNLGLAPKIIFLTVQDDPDCVDALCNGRKLCVEAPDVLRPFDRDQRRLGGATVLLLPLASLGHVLIRLESRGASLLVVLVLYSS